MAERVWYRSLYWRIGLGFVLLLGVLLAVQGVISLWLAGRFAALIPGRSPAQFAETLASELSIALAERMDLDLPSFVQERHPTTLHPYTVVLRDGRTAANPRIVPPLNAGRAARGRLASLTGEPVPGTSPPPGSRPDPSFGPIPAPAPGGQGFGGRDRVPPDPATAVPAPRSGGAGGAGGGVGRGGGGGRGGRGGRAPGLEFATISIDGAPYGVVTVPSESPPLPIALRGLGPTLAGVAVVLLLVGATLAALLVFRPAHRRLHALEDAARAFGAGNAAARARADGGDEVASLARAFNQMADDLTGRAAALAESDRARRQLLADISHELATPLAAIRGYAETLSMQDVQLDEPTRLRYLGVIGDETERLEHLVGDLLELARLEGGGAPPRREPVKVRALLDRIEQRHEAAVRARAIALDIRLAPESLTVVGDAARLEQALQNLVANAVRHTPEGGRILVSAVPAGGAVRVVVEDSGPGIPEEHLPRVFDRFYKVDQSRTGTSVPSGSGLGLSIVRAIVQSHGGQVTASNAPGGGARFEVTLPAGLPATPDL
jgi:signal transduction histidine kinase